MNRLSLAFFAAALLIVGVTVAALALRAGAVEPWEPQPAATESAPRSEVPPTAAQF